MWQHVPPDSAESSIAAITTPSKELVWNERLMALALLQAVGAGTINVIDFGGSFGLHLSTFLKVARNTPYLWTIIEIPTIVDEGRKRIPPGAALHYETEIEQGPASPDLIITSGTLQYLATPYEMLSRFADVAPKYLFIDRLPVAVMVDDFVTIQHVPGRHFADGQARDVPAWWFSRNRFFQALDENFSIEWTAQTGEYAEVHAMPVKLEAVMLRRKQ